MNEIFNIVMDGYRAFSAEQIVMNTMQSSVELTLFDRGLPLVDDDGRTLAFAPQYRLRFGDAQSVSIDDPFKAKYYDLGDFWFDANGWTIEGYSGFEMQITARDLICKLSAA